MILAELRKKAFTLIGNEQGLPLVFTLEATGLQHLTECCESLFDSELGRRYFNSIIQVEAFIQPGLERGEIIHVINNKGDFLGFAWAVEQGAFCSYPYIQAIAVKRAYRSIGAGSFLLSHIEQTCFARSTCIFTLSSSASPKLLRFFHRHGYRRVGKIPNLCLPDLDELLLMKTNNDLSHN